MWMSWGGGGGESARDMEVFLKTLAYEAGMLGCAKIRRLGDWVRPNECGWLGLMVDELVASGSS